MENSSNVVINELEYEYDKMLSKMLAKSACSWYCLYCQLVNKFNEFKSGLSETEKNKCLLRIEGAIVALCELESVSFSDLSEGEIDEIINSAVAESRRHYLDNFGSIQYLAQISSEESWKNNLKVYVTGMINDPVKIKDGLNVVANELIECRVYRERITNAVNQNQNNATEVVCSTENNRDR